MNPTFTLCPPPMEQTYSSSSDDSMYPALNLDVYSTPGAIDIPRSQSSFNSFDSFDDFSPANSYTLQGVPDVYPFNASPNAVVPSSPFDSAPLQWLNWEGVSLPDYLGIGGSPPEPPKQPPRPFGCSSCGKAFTRAADLKRHESSVHFPIKQDCPVEGCLRKDDNGFPRRDHLIEHLRSYHHWDVPKRRASKRTSKASP